MCESSGDWSAVSPDGRNIGGFQVNLIHGWTREELLDPAINLLAAYSIWKEQGWTPWSCRP